MQRICDLSDVTEGEIVRVELAGQPALGVTRVEGTAYVFPVHCPHAEESLENGWVEDGRIICPVHFAEFELGSGVAHNKPSGCGNMTFFDCEERDGGIFARLV